MKIGIIGAGNLGSSLARGFLKSGAIDTNDLKISDIDEKKLNALASLGMKTTTDNKQLVEDSDVVFIAVKPGMMDSVLKETKNVSSNRLFVSVAAGVSTEFIEKRTKARVIRVMPNICGEVAEMASCYSLGRTAIPEDGELIEQLLNSIGTAFKVDEDLMETVTGLSGSGPAYFYFFMKGLQNAGVELGLPSDIALKLVAQTAKGAGEMAMIHGDLEKLIKNVCTPGGTTIEGIKMLEKGKVEESVGEAVKAATKRARELLR